MNDTQNMHITIQEGRSLPQLERCTTCCKAFHCPFCSSALFQPAKLNKLRTHLESHFRRAIVHQGYTIHRCGLQCRPQLHYHCPHCQAMLLRRTDFINHLSVCKKKDVNKEKHVNKKKQPAISLMRNHSQNMHITIQEGRSLPQLERCTTCCKAFHCPFCSSALFQPAKLNKLRTHLESHFRRAIVHQGYTIHRCGLQCRPQLHYHCPHCQAMLLRRTDFINHLSVCQKKQPTITPTIQTTAKTMPPPTTTSPGLEARTQGDGGVQRTVNASRLCLTRRRPSCSFIMNTMSGSSMIQLSRIGLRLCASKGPRCRTRALSLTKVTSTCLPHVSPLTPVPRSQAYSSNIRVRSYLNYMKRKIIPPPCPPYHHVCQVGDPVLRSHAAAVDPETITGPEIQKVINTLVGVMRKLECVGLSAPQIGVPLRILALEYPEKMLKESSPASRKVRGISAQPLRIFVNPQLRVLDGQTVLFQEACESISGFSATVPRYQSVEVSGLNEKGEGVSWQASGWAARMAQHEMDHLEGVLYIDRMDSKTFINIKWPDSNE